MARRAGLDFGYLSRIEAKLVPPPSDDKVLALADALGRSNLNARRLRELADEARVPNEVHKEAVIRNPEVGALLRRLRAHRLTPEEADRLREIGGNSQRSKPDLHGPAE